MTPTALTPDQSARFWARALRGAPDVCWPWLGTVQRNGYGSFAIAGHQSGLAHRVAFVDAVGPIPEGLTIDHLCRVRHCVNPAHLEPVTQRENSLRGDTVNARHAATTHCPAKHEYDAANTYLDPRGKRECRACRRTREEGRKPRRWREASTSRGTRG